jgi:ubiquitin-protein ligase
MGHSLIGYLDPTMASDLAPQIISRLLSEIRDLVRNPIEGIAYVESDDNSLSEIHAIISGPGKT